MTFSNFIQLYLSLHALPIIDNYMEIMSHCIKNIDVVMVPGNCFLLFFDFVVKYETHQLSVHYRGEVIRIIRLSSSQSGTLKNLLLIVYTMNGFC